MAAEVGVLFVGGTPLIQIPRILVQKVVSSYAILLPKPKLCTVTGIKDILTHLTT